MKLACVTGEGCSLNPGPGLYVLIAVGALILLGIVVGCFKKRQNNVVVVQQGVAPQIPVIPLQQQNFVPPV